MYQLEFVEMLIITRFQSQAAHGNAKIIVSARQTLMLCAVQGQRLMQKKLGVYTAVKTFPKLKGNKTIP